MLFSPTQQLASTNFLGRLSASLTSHSNSCSTC